MKKADPIITEFFKTNNGFSNTTRTALNATGTFSFNTTQDAGEITTSVGNIPGNSAGNLSIDTNGSELLKFLSLSTGYSSITLNAASTKVYLIAYQNNNAYIYYLQGIGSGSDKTVTATHGIVQVAVLQNVAPDSLSSTDFILNTLTTPIAIDLNHDGAIQYSGLSTGLTHDYVGDGSLVATAWVGAQDGLLASHNPDGSIKISFATQAGETDLQGLAKVYDTNHDGIFDAKDAGFNNFGVWQDANSDGIVQEGEFRTLADRGIISLSLTSDGLIHTAAGGDVTIFGQTTYTMTDGSTGIAEDVAFAVSAVTPADGNGVQDVYHIASVTEAAVVIDNFSINDGDRVDLSSILHPADSVHSMISMDQNGLADSHSTITVNIGGVDYEVATLYGKEIGVPDALGAHAGGSALSDALHGASWTDVVDVSSDHGGPASISAAGGALTNSYSNEAGDWTVQIKSGTATVDAANKQITFSSDHAGNEAIITTADGTAHEISNVDKILWH